MENMIFHAEDTVLEISQSGRIVSVQAGKQELLRAASPLLTVEFQDNTELVSRKAFLTEPGIIRCICGQKGYVELALTAQDGYFRITLHKINVAEAKQIRLFELRPGCKKYCGIMGGMFSDDRHMICLRSLSLKGSVEVLPEKQQIYAYSEGEFIYGNQSVSFALTAARRDRIADILKTMTEKEPVPKSLSGGAWALESEKAQGSYVFADLKAEETEAWIKMAERAHFSFIHIHAWWHTLGHYGINRNFYPNGKADMKKAVEKIHKAGLKASFHTLTACIEPDDEWVTPVPVDDLIVCAHYTLSKPVSETDDVIYINEKPIPGHELVWSYSCNSNAVKIGKEIILYSGISYEKPYCFKGCSRGVFGTCASNHAEGDDASYLQARYLAFYPEPDGKTADALADAIADLYHYLNLDGMYFDGSEGMKSRYGTDAMRWKIFRRLPNDAIIEASNINHNNWWFHTRMGAWDHPLWAFKRCHERHVQDIKTVPAGNLLQPQMGWWAARGPAPGCRGQFTDELEYFMMKNMGFNAPMSLQELRPSGIQWNERIYEMLTILGWYERFRLAHYFRRKDLERLQVPDKEFQLRMNDRGQWRLFPMQTRKIRLPDLSRKPQWSFRNENGPQPLKARIECLYTLDLSPEKGVSLTDFSGTHDICNRTARNVAMQISSIPPDEQTAFHRLRLKAENHGRVKNGAWAMAGMQFPHPYLSAHRGGGFGVWVKGDQSGALLNFHFKNPEAFHSGTISENYLKIDFSGWKYCMFLFREPDVESMPDYHWPYPHTLGNDEHVRTSMLDTEHIEHIDLYLNCIPSHGSTDIEIGDLTAFPQKEMELTEICLNCNQKEIKLPFSMQSGDYAEFDGTGSVEYFSEQGRLLNRYRIPNLTVQKGNNHFQLQASAQKGDAARAEFTVSTMGSPFGGKSEQIDWKHLQTEYELPRIILTEDGLDNVWKIRCRDEKGDAPNDLPALDFELKVISAGNGSVQNGDLKTAAVDQCISAEAYQVNEKNHYERYLEKSENGSTAKSLVSYDLKTVPSRMADRSALHFEAVSSRGGDNMGWASVGRHFAEPVNLSGQAAIGIWLRSCVSSAKLSLQLVDCNGKSVIFEVPLCDRTWHYNEYPLESAEIDLSRITCIIYSINDIMANNSAWVEIDEVTAVGSCSSLENPSLTINRQKVEFPCLLRTGDTLQSSDGKHLAVKNAKGETILTRPITGDFPKLKPGVNTLCLNFKRKTNETFRVSAEVIKKYS